MFDYKTDFYIPLFDMILCLSNALDHISPVVKNHHMNVTYIALSLCEELQIDEHLKKNTLIASALHDIGIFTVAERIKSLEFDNPQEIRDNKHTEIGYQLTKKFHLFQQVAPIIRYHHSPWSYGHNLKTIDYNIKIPSHIIYLADKVDAFIAPEKNILSQTQSIQEYIKVNVGSKFNPDIADAFLNLSKKEAFWFNLTYPDIDKILEKKTRLFSLKLNFDELKNLSLLFSHIIDFRSRFTATHSSGVAACAEALANIAGLPLIQCEMMKIAGYLHDLGKLAIPAEILEKPGKLDPEEINIIKSHTYITYRILDNIKEMETINRWASLHHERLDGNGYPFRLTKEELSNQERMMAIADVFTAITEDRPYRKGMPAENALKILKSMCDTSILDKNIVNILIENFDFLNSIRHNAQQRAREEYEEFEKFLQKQ